MERSISSNPDLFCLYYEAITAPAPALQATNPMLLFKLFYKKSRSALRRQMTPTH